MAGENIKVLSSARNIGVTFDSHFNFEKHVMNTCKTAFFHLCISQFHLRPALPPPRAMAFFLPWMENSWGWRILSCQIPRCGDKKRGQIPHPLSTLQQFSLIAQSNSAILSILMFDFLFQLTSSFVIALGF